MSGWNAIYRASIRTVVHNVNVYGPLCNCCMVRNVTDRSVVGYCAEQSSRAMGQGWAACNDSTPIATSNVGVTHAPAVENTVSFESYIPTFVILFVGVCLVCVHDWFDWS